MDPDPPLNPLFKKWSKSGTGAKMELEQKWNCKKEVQGSVLLQKIKFVRLQKNKLYLVMQFRYNTMQHIRKQDIIKGRAIQSVADSVFLIKH